MKKMTQNNNYCVYAHINKINGKAYIGITNREPQIRWGKNGHGYQHQPKFYYAIEKYGWDNFEHLILIENLTEEEALNCETEYIEELDAIENGYNILLHGIKSCAEKRKKKIYCITTNTLYPSIKEAAEICNTEATRIIDNCKGRNSGTKGLQWAYWDEEKNTYIEPEKFIVLPKSNSIEVYCIEKDMTFPSINQAAKWLGVDDNDLRKVINGKRNGIRGLHFIRANEKDRINEVISKKNGNHRPIYCVETKQVFENMQEAANSVGVTAQSIMKNCQGKTKACKGYHFKYYADLFKSKGEKEEDG